MSATPPKKLGAEMIVILIGYAFYRIFVVESKVTRVDYIVGPSLLCKII